MAILVNAHGPQAEIMAVPARATARSAITLLAALATARLVHAPLTTTSTTTGHLTTTHTAHARSEALLVAEASVEAV